MSDSTDDERLGQDHAGALLLQYIFNEAHRSTGLTGSLFSLAMPEMDDHAMHVFTYSALMTFGESFRELARDNGTIVGRDPSKGQAMPTFTVAAPGEIPEPVRLMTQMMNCAVVEVADMAHDILEVWESRFSWMDRRQSVVFLVNQFHEIYHGRLTVIFKDKP
jgi:hypothetical protein